MDRKKYKSKGYIALTLKKTGDIDYYIKTKEDVLKMFNGEDLMQQFEHNIYDLMSGKEFYENVDEGYFIDYDGTIAHIFIDGYKSNLGLHHKGICQGNFLVDGAMFLDLCDKFNVEVNWANK